MRRFEPCRLRSFRASPQKLHPPGFEPRTFAVLKRRHNQLDHGCSKRMEGSRCVEPPSGGSQLSRPHGVAVALRIPNPTTAVRFRLRSLFFLSNTRPHSHRVHESVLQPPGVEPGPLAWRARILTVRPRLRGRTHRFENLSRRESNPGHPRDRRVY